MNCFDFSLKLCPACKASRDGIWGHPCVIQTYKNEIQIHIEKDALKEAFVFWLGFPWMAYYIENTVKIYYPEHLDLFRKYSVLV
jgi:hypothetical protein